jgi:GrpB-like predicted nucleotidyltransferase (UPF0157 family)
VIGRRPRPLERCAQSGGRRGYRDAVTIVGLDHVQVAAPVGCEGEARRFYGGLLGLMEIPKPPALGARGGVWFAAGEQQLHVGVAQPFGAAAKAHPALRVSPGALEELAGRLAEAGSPVRWDEQRRGVRRFFTEDPWGNRIELVEAGDEPVRIVPYDATWPSRFEHERAALERAIGPWITGGVHHVGSTAVPGLDAKPTIDMMVGVRSLQEARTCFGPLAALSYQYAPYRPDEMHWFCKPDPSRRLYHLHLVPTGSPRYRATLAFRDRLRADRSLAQRYAELKRSLAGRFEDDREAYTAGKADFIVEQSERATRS